MARSKPDVDAELVRIAGMGVDDLRTLWRRRRGGDPPPALTKDLIARVLAWAVQVEAFGEPARVRRILNAAHSGAGAPERRMKPGSVIMREYDGVVHEVTVLPEGFLWREKTWPSLSAIACEITGTKWNGLRFFGVAQSKSPERSSRRARRPHVGAGPSAPLALRSADPRSATGADQGRGGPL
ncbi:MAG: DUF2924 domain-containing protein [Beijerinckiaceae bacterium]